MTEALILISEDSPTRRSRVPEDNGTIFRIAYEVLSENPYVFTEAEFHHEVHVVRRQRQDLNIESYDIRRSKLLKQFGWGIHRDSQGKLALVAADSPKYTELSQELHTERAYRNSAA